MVFPPDFSKPRGVGIVQPRKRYVVLKVLKDNQGLYFSKRAMCADTTCNEWL